jgi:hypothetical protein
MDALICACPAKASWLLRSYESITECSLSAKDACQGANGDWERFEPGLDVIVK